MKFLNKTPKYLNINVKDTDSTTYIPIRIKLSMCHIPAI